MGRPLQSVLPTVLTIAIAFFQFSKPSNAQLGGLFGSSVETISTKDLLEKLKTRLEEQKKAQAAEESISPASFILVDVRGDDETAVSIIPGAITKAKFEEDLEKHRSKLIIPYCTVGGRSGRYAKELAGRNLNVKNYSDSILGWVGEGLPLVTLEGKPTKRVHTYSDRYKIPAEYEKVSK
ncbi:MAG: rhodanese-like domain-containing protein [Planctomycetota bacterium]